MIICTYEDRRAHLTALQLLAHSLGAVCPDQRLAIWCPESLVSTFREGLQGTHVSLHVWEHPHATGWSVKPSLLLEMLKQGYEEVLWMDSDVIVTSEFRDLFDRSDVIGVAGEPHWITRSDRIDRASAWGLPIARRFPSVINSCVVRVTSMHGTLLEAWRRCLASSEYLSAQMLPFWDRPPHLRGDQDALDALLTSSLFTNLPVKLLRPGREIAHCHMADGYSLVDRLRHAWRSLPPLIHSQAFRPWESSSWRPVWVEVSPYVLVAQRYRDVLSGDTSWLDATSMAGRVLRLISGGEPSVAGLLPALTQEVERAVRIRTRLAAFAALALSRKQLVTRPVRLIG
jgi:hypothetical protein